MKIEFDQAKRDKTLSDRGLDFTDAAEVFRVTVLMLSMIGLITVKSALLVSVF